MSVSRARDPEAEALVAADEADRTFLVSGPRPARAAHVDTRLTLFQSTINRANRLAMANTIPTSKSPMIDMVNQPAMEIRNPTVHGRSRSNSKAITTGTRNRAMADTVRRSGIRGRSHDFNERFQK